MYIICKYSSAYCYFYLSFRRLSGVFLFDLLTYLKKCYFSFYGIFVNFNFLNRDFFSWLLIFHFLMFYYINFPEPIFDLFFISIRFFLSSF